MLFPLVSLLSVALCREVVYQKAVPDEMVGVTVGSDAYLAAVAAQRKRQTTEAKKVLITEHFTPVPGCPTGAGINPTDPQYADCCNEANKEKFVSIEEPVDQCLTQDGVRFYTYELSDTGNNMYSQCVYAEADRAGDSNCVLPSAAVCTDAAVPLNTCSLVYASIDGEMQVEGAPDATSVWTKVVMTTEPIRGKVSKPSTFKRREYTTSDCTGDWLILELAHDVCYSAETNGVASEAGIFVQFDNAYDQVKKLSKYCLYHSEVCGNYDRPDDVTSALLVPFLCREYEVGKCETDGAKSHMIEIVDSVICDANTDPNGCMEGTDGAASTLTIGTSLLGALAL
eukprot:CAMPEP_0170738988 /NCGR_PEP_ID=MMETSP0437-20130122/4929_1 /TAXON_ID=0 /ORGANISM="Sexangularia sp." /LENGTH=340 /DNA_ID=CAMNT_0011077429 /DNA_START=34 /DNA_END=1052 /DNA_ORIENTATION=+